MMPAIRTLIVDDDPLSRDAVRIQLEKESDVEILDDASSAEEALERILAQRPDVVFLDIEMPGKSGIDLMKELDDDVRPFVVFVSAFDRFAVDAFDPAALAYLLKPFDQERFARAMEQTREQVHRRRREETASVLLAALEARADAPPMPGQPMAQGPDRLMIREKGRVVLIDPTRLLYIRSDGNYLQLHLAERFHLVRATMDQIMERLDPGAFVRIHRSTIVNINRVEELRPDTTGSYTVVVEGGAELTMSRSYRDEVLGRVL